MLFRSVSQSRYMGCDEDGYVGNMDKNEPEYLAAYRDKPCDMLVLNLLDIDNAEFVSEDCIMKARNFANSMINKGYNVVIFDTKAESMAPAIALLVQYLRGEFYEWDYEHSKACFMLTYPAFNPKNGIETKIKETFKK